MHYNYSVSLVTKCLENPLLFISTLPDRNMPLMEADTANQGCLPFCKLHSSSLTVTSGLHVHYIWHHRSLRRTGKGSLHVIIMQSQDSEIAHILKLHKTYTSQLAIHLRLAVVFWVPTKPAVHTCFTHPMHNAHGHMAWCPVSLAHGVVSRNWIMSNMKFNQTQCKTTLDKTLKRFLIWLCSELLVCTGNKESLSQASICVRTLSLHGLWLLFDSAVVLCYFIGSY